MGKAGGGSHLFIRRAKCGFTLVEMIITTALIGMIILFLFNIYPNAVLAIKRGEHRLKASYVAQAVLEKKMASSFYDIDAPLTEKSLTGDDGMIYTVSCETFHLPDTNPQNLRRLKVTVIWEEQRSRCSVFKEYDVCDIRH